MKILIDARLYGLENAGLGRYVMNLIGELTKLDKKNKYIVLLTKRYFDGLTLPANWKKVLTDYRHYSISEQVRLPKLIKKENPDITHFPHFNVPLSFSGKFVVTIHDLLMHKNVGLAATTLPAPFYFVKRLGYKAVFRKAVNDSVRVIVPSLAVSNEVGQYYKVSPDKIKVIYEGVDEKIISGDDVRGKYQVTSPYFIYVGNAYPHKNLKRLIEAIVLLNKRDDRKISLVIVSARNVFTKRLEKIVKSSGAEDFVKLLGFVPDGDLGALFRDSLGFVFPSLSEGFGLPGLEAMSSGTLVLASDIPVFKEIYKDNAVYFNPFDFSSIEKAMQKAVELSVGEKVERILKGQDFVKRYSWTKMAKETLKIYAETGSTGIRSSQ